MIDKFVHAETLGDCWIQCIKKVLNANPHNDEDVGILELLGLSIEVRSPDTDDRIISELGDEKVVAGMLKKFSAGVVMNDRPFTYGQRIFDMNGVNQFDWMSKRLRDKPETKSATVCLLVPGDNSPNLPCLTALDAKIRQGALELQFFFRSQNILGRQYANLIALAKFQKDLADSCGVDVGGMRGYIASAHIYDYDIEIAQRIVDGGSSRVVDEYYSKGPKSVRTKS